MKKAIQKSYGKKGEDIVNRTMCRGIAWRRDAVVKVEIPAEWASIEDKGFVHVSWTLRVPNSCARSSSRSTA